MQEICFANFSSFVSCDLCCDIALCVPSVLISALFCGILIVLAPSRACSTRFSNPISGLNAARKSFSCIHQSFVDYSSYLVKFLEEAVLPLQNVSFWL